MTHNFDDIRRKLEICGLVSSYIIGMSVAIGGARYACLWYRSDLCFHFCQEAAAKAWGILGKSFRGHMHTSFVFVNTRIRGMDVGIPSSSKIWEGPNQDLGPLHLPALP